MPKKKVTNINIPADSHSRAEAAAILIKESLSDFITAAIEARIDKLREEGKLAI